VLALAFTGSGGAGLLVEQAFEKLLGTLLGTSTEAGAAVLSMYFAGLTLGGWLYARRTRTRPARVPLAAYAALEAVIAILALSLALGCDRLIPLFVPLVRHARLLVAAIWILPITMPLGATFPAIVDALDELPESSRRVAVSAFYGLNLLGAIAAAALGPFVAFPRLGVDGVLGLAAALDATAAVIALSLRKALPARDEVRAAGSRADSRLAADASLLAVAATSGFVLFGLEVLWTHLIGCVLGPSAYAFGMMLAVVLAGLGIGAAIGGIAASRIGRVPPMLPGAALIAAALLLALTHARWPDAPHDLAVVGREATSFAGAEAARAWMAVRLLLAPTVALGTVYPLLLRLDSFPRVLGGRTSARMGAVNAIGCVAGALLVGFVAIPTIGSDRAMRMLAALCVVAGAIIVRRRYALVSLALVAVLFVLPKWDVLKLTSGEHVYFTRFAVFPDTRLRFVREEPAGGFTTVVENPTRKGVTRWLLTNGKFQGNDAGEMTAQDACALLPMQYVRGWDEALVIGLGTGRSAYAVENMGFAHVTIAEISPGIVEAARKEFAHINGGVLDAPNVRVAVDDARNLLLLESHTYDLVTMEISSVWFASSTNLYSREFYALARSRLRPGGVLQQWIQLHHIGLSDLETVIATIRGVFPQVSFFVGGGQGIVVASDDAQVATAAFCARFEAHHAAFSDLEPTHLGASRLLSPAEVDALAASSHAVVNTDRNRHLEWTTPAFAFERRDMKKENIASLAARSRFETPPVSPDAEGRVADALRRVDAPLIRRVVGLD
jgi:spermidine synthase